MPQQLWEKLRRKGLRGSLRILRERFLYRHWVLLVLERELVTPLPLPPAFSGLAAKAGTPGTISVSKRGESRSCMYMKEP